MQTWLDVAPDDLFSLRNLPYGCIAENGELRCVVRLGQYVVDLSEIYEAGLLALPFNPFRSNLNLFASLGPGAWRVTRNTLQRLLGHEETRLRDDQALCQRAIHGLESVIVQMPVTVGDYTDFYSSREHATNVGSLFRPDAPLLPNWLHLPVAYHGRASSVVLDGTDIRRPSGQFRPDPNAPPVFGLTRALDYELEVAAVIGPGNPIGQPIRIEDAESHIFGLVLLNDWSARDIQSWEYQPLGPFLGKNFATSISPWVVPLAALEPWRCAGPVQEPVLPYLSQVGDPSFDLILEAKINDTVVTQTNFKYLYWSLKQQIAHHTVNGCPLRPGDLLASGTISGPTPESRGCLLERTQRGTAPVPLSDETTRKWLEDGDQVTLRGWAGHGKSGVGLGEVSGQIVAGG